jgi:SAM-dependent methyltransferase
VPHRSEVPAASYGNLQKHLNPNPVQRWLLRRFHRRVVDVLRRSAATCVLDAGCGEGFTLRQIEEAGLAVRSVGADLDRTALAWGRQNGVAMAPLLAADMHRLPFAEGSFDLVLGLEVLEHLPVPAAGLAELLRVSRRHVLVSVPHEPWFRGLNLLRGKHVAALGNDPEHLHQFGLSAFRRLVASQASLVLHCTPFPWQLALLAKA